MIKRLSMSGIAGVLIALYLRLAVPDMAALMAGAGWDGVGEDNYSLYLLVCWLLLYMPVWVAGLRQYEEEFLRAHMVIHRFRRLTAWWRRVSWQSLLSIILSYLCMGIVLAVTMEGHWNEQMTVSFVMITVHGLGLTAAALWLKLLTGSMLIGGGVILIMEATSKVLSFYQLLSPKYNFFSWGMSVYSDRIYGSGGYHLEAVVMIQILFIASTGVFCCGPMRELLLRRINNAKND